MISKGITCLLCRASLFYYAKGQELEPRAYAALSKNLNTIAVAYGFSRGNVLTDSSRPITHFKISLESLTSGYFRTFEVAHKLARVQVNRPLIRMFGKLQITAHDTSGSPNGFADARIRLRINLTGTSAMGRKTFAYILSERERQKLNR